MPAADHDEKLERAILHRNEGRHEEARTLFRELLAEHPDDARAEYHYAWLHDKLGEERGAVPHYERAIALGLADEDLRGALLGLGSTYRTLGAYDQAIAVLRRGHDAFPESREFSAFLAMALYNVGQHTEAMALLLRALADTSTDAGVQRFGRAIRYYADRLDEVTT